MMLPLPLGSVVPTGTSVRPEPVLSPIRLLVMVIGQRPELLT